MNCHVGRRGVAALAGAVLLLVAGCAGIPDDGGVHEVASDDGDQQSTVRYAPVGPRDGATPQAVVRGFLDSMLGYPVSTGTAQKFLTKRAAAAWEPSAATTVYSDPTIGQPQTVSDADSNGDPGEAVDVAVTRSGRLDASGRLTPESGDGRISLHLVRVDGEWRITDPPPGIVVTHKFFEDYYRALDLYWLDLSGRRLVPDPVFLPTGDQLPTALLTALLRGPAADLRSVVRTDVPAGTRLRTSAPVHADGSVDVRLSTRISRLSRSQQQHLSAQVVWTLRQLPDVHGVRVGGDDRAVTIDGESLQSVGSWDGYGVGLQPSEGTVRAVRADRLVVLDQGRVTALAGTWGKDARGARSFAVGSGHVAAVRSSGASVLVGSLAGGPDVTFSGHDVVPPSWDPEGRLWLVDARGGGTRVRLVTDDHAATLAAPGFAGVRVSSFAVSPDGARYAVTRAVTGGHVLAVGLVRRDTSGRVAGLGAPHVVPGATSALRTAASVTWTSATDLAFLARDTYVGEQVHTVRVDGSGLTGSATTTSALLTGVAARQLAVSGDVHPDLYVVDDRHRLWNLRPGGEWHEVPGAKVTALSVEP